MIRELKVKNGLSAERLNLIIAICAILISAASFYATYLQANAAEKQVKAMTLPLLQFEHGNYNEHKGERVITFSLNNAGVGPAIVKSVNFKYKDISYTSLQKFLFACCTKEIKASDNVMPSLKTISDGGYLTSTIQNVTIPGQTNHEFLFVYPNKNELNDLFKKVDIERRSLSLKVCFCSLLDDCYVTEKSGIVEPVEQCSI